MAKQKNNKKVAANNKEVCPICGQVHDRVVRKDLGIRATQDETESLLLLNNRVQTATQVAQPTALPQGVTPEQVQVFVQAAINARAEALSMQRGWWNEIFAKYPALPKDKNVFVDFNTGEFYLNETEKH